MALTKKYVGTSDSLSVCWFGSFVIHACHLRFSRHFLPFYIFWIKILLLDAHRNMPTSKVTKNMCQFLFLQICFQQMVEIKIFEKFWKLWTEFFGIRSSEKRPDQKTPQIKCINFMDFFKLKLKNNSKNSKQLWKALSNYN